MRAARSSLALVAVLAVTLAACGSRPTIDARPGTVADRGGDPIDSSDRGDDPGDPVDEPATDLDPAGDPDDMARILDDIEAFWADTYPDVYGDDYEPLEGGFHPYSPSVDPPDCGERLTYRDVAGNAYYCPVGDFIAWDEVGLLADLEEEFGAYAVALVMAHEWGHAIQARAGVDTRRTRTIDLEQQADCFAGAWTEHLVAGDGELDLGGTSLDTALAGMLRFSDTPGTPASDPSAHGLGFDRASAFQDGYAIGPERCAAYPDDPPVLLSDLFEQQGSFTPNNMPYVDAIPLIVADLNTYWSAQLGGDFDPIEDVVPYDPDGVASDLPQCGDEASDPELLRGAVLYCASTNTVAWDNPFLRRIHVEIGDFGSGILLANQWSRAAQSAMGIDSTAAGAELHNDCITGSWVAYLLLGNSDNITLTPDDLDEVVQAFLQVNVGVVGNEVTGERLAFDRLQALRTGIFEGRDACGDYEPS